MGSQRTLEELHRDMQEVEETYERKSTRLKEVQCEERQLCSMLVALRDRKKKLEGEMQQWYRNHKDLEQVRAKDARRAQMLGAVERRLGVTPPTPTQAQHNHKGSG